MQKPTEEDYRIDICEALRLNEEYNKIKDRPWYRQIKAGRNEYEIEHVDVEPPEVEKARHAAQYANYKSCEAAYRRLIELESMLDAWVSMTDRDRVHAPIGLWPTKAEDELLDAHLRIKKGRENAKTKA